LIKKIYSLRSCKLKQFKFLIYQIKKSQVERGYCPKLKNSQRIIAINYFILSTFFNLEDQGVLKLANAGGKDYNLC
jgi:hypothetical protein